MIPDEAGPNRVAEKQRYFQVSRLPSLLRLVPARQAGRAKDEGRTGGTGSSQMDQTGMDGTNRTTANEDRLSRASS
jgi:hypothetical protein